MTSLSSHQVMVSSNFTGTELVLFGSVERDAATVRAAAAMTSSSPCSARANAWSRGARTAFLGIWTNAESYTFDARRPISRC